MQFSVKVIIAACAVVGVAEIGRHSLSSNKASRRRSLRTGNAGTTGLTELTGFVDAFANAEVDDDAGLSAAADFGVNDVSADSSNDASVDPAGASDSSSGSSTSMLSFGATAFGEVIGTDDGVATGDAAASGGILSFYGNVAESQISPTMVIPGTVTNATIMTKGTKGTKTTGGDGDAAAVPGVEMVGVVNGTQGVIGFASVFGESETDGDTGTDAFASTSSFVDASGEASQESTSAAGPTQDGESDMTLEIFGDTEVTRDGYGNAEAEGDLIVNGSTVGSGFATFDNTTASP